jgi:type IV secretion system protein VirB2
MKNSQFKYVLLMAILLFGPSIFASTMGGLSFFAGPMEAITASFTGPITRTICIVGFVGAFGMLMFGADLTGFAKTLTWLVLICTAVINVIPLFDFIAGGTGATF